MHPEEGASFVTGGSGFIGGRLIERLVAAVPVRALARSDRSAAAVEACGAEAVRGDLADVEAITAAARGCDAAYHLAANVEMWGSWDDFIRDNVTGTENVLTVAIGKARRELGYRPVKARADGLAELRAADRR